MGWRPWLVIEILSRKHLIVYVRVKEDLNYENDHGNSKIGSNHGNIKEAEEIRQRNRDTLKNDFNHANLCDWEKDDDFIWNSEVMTINWVKFCFNCSQRNEDVCSVLHMYTLSFLLYRTLRKNLGKVGILRRGLVEDVNIIDMKGSSEVGSVWDWVRLQVIFMAAMMNTEIQKVKARNLENSCI